MRRCLHTFLVGLLVVSTSADAARGCWYLRKRCPRMCEAIVVCPPSWACRPVATVAASTTSDETVECFCGVAHAEQADEVMAGSLEVVVLDEEIVAAEIIEPEIVVERVEALAPPSPATAAASVIELPAAAVPELEPVVADIGQASVDESAASPEPALPTAPPEPIVVEEANLFELADAAEPAQERSPAEQTPADEPDSEADGESLDPDRDDSPEPANPLDAAEWRTGEPARLWIDATGRHAVVGVLVDVRGDGTCILDTGAGMLQVPAAALRRRDRDYAEQAAERLAAARSPAVSDTVAR